jgi:hypothetical protein
LYFILDFGQIWSFVIYIYALLFTWKSKKTKKKNFIGGFPECLGCGTQGRGFFFLKKRQISSPSAWAAALGEEGFFKKKTKIFSECCTRGRKTLGEENKKKKTGSAIGTALGEAFPDCTIFGTRERRLSGERISRRLFPECNWAFPECN